MERNDDKSFGSGGFGQGSTGGVVNMVSKRPQAETAGEIGVRSLQDWQRGRTAR